MIRLSDMHFHLDGYPNHRQIYNQINELEQHTLCVTNSPDIFEACLSTYKETTFVRFGLGFHPLQKPNDEAIEKFKRLALKTRYIGEVGLDFSRASQKERDRQIAIFDSVLLCAGQGKIISIHSLNAEIEVLRAIEKYEADNKYILHWYCGDMATLEKFIAFGCYFSLNIKQIANKPDIVKSIPIDRILIESDAPKASSMAGKKFQPKDLNRIYEKIGGVLNCDITATVNANLRNVLGRT